MDQTKVIVLLGRPGAGKGTQGELLKEEFGFVHISTGEILRAAIKEQCALGLEAKQFVEKGSLVPDDLISSLVSDRLRDLFLSSTPGVIFDGFPRTVAQAKSLQEAIVTLGIRLTFIIELRLKDSAALSRIEGRKIESGTEHRNDDRSEVVAARMEVYENQTRPVVDYYDQLGVLRVVDASGNKTDVFARIVESCGLLAANN
jgi:adenylate kinase